MNKNKVFKKEFPIRNRPGLLIDSDFAFDHVVYYLDDARTKPAKAYFEKDFDIIPLNR